MFGELTRDFGDRWSVTGGGRWFSYGIATGSQTEFPYTPMYNSPFSDFESDDRSYLLKVSLSYRLDDQTNAYVTRSEGYRIGGGNNFRVCTDAEIALLTDADTGNDPPQSGCIYADQALIRPDTTTNYEVGLRRSWRDERFTLSATVFQVDWTDIQVAGLTPFSAEPITLNGGGAVSRGIELASAATLTNAWRLRGSCVVYARGAEPGRARPARRRCRRLRGRPAAGGAAPSGEPAYLLRHTTRQRHVRAAVRLQLHRRRDGTATGTITDDAECGPRHLRFSNAWWWIS